MATFKHSQAKFFSTKTNCNGTLGRNSGDVGYKGGLLWDLKKKNWMLINSSVIYAQSSEGSPFSSLETPCCLHKGDVSGVGIGHRKAALHNS